MTSKPISRGALAFCAALLGLTPGCLFRGGGPPPRSFEFEPVPAVLAGSTSPADREFEPKWRVRFDRAQAPGHLGQRMAWRQASGEVGELDPFRWTEAPGDVLVAELERRLERTGFAVWRASPSWRVGIELESLGEYRGQGRSAEVAFEVSVEDDVGRLRFRQRYFDRRPLPRNAEEVTNVEVLVEQLGELSGNLLDRVAADLTRFAESEAWSILPEEEEQAP
jgi:hypothetical protein